MKTIMTKPGNIDEYIAGFPPEIQKNLETVRARIKKAAPSASEAISYGIPAFNLHNHYLVYFAAYKNHIGIYPAPVENEALTKELAGYRTGKGTLQFLYDRPMPLQLITRIVESRIKENKERFGSKVTRTPTAQKGKSSQATDEDPVLAYLGELEEPVKAETEAVRDIIKKTLPDLRERIKWSAPSYHYMQQDFLTFGPHKNGKTMLVFHHPAIVKITSSILEGNYKDRRLMYFNGTRDVVKKKKELERILKELVRLVSPKKKTV